ncbi:MAG: hypothetical protein DBX62_01245 [Clostridia bacterium]|nr:MAG: hypothetical protein DBX62_01245 [Clostridia bacterium]
MTIGGLVLEIRSPISLNLPESFRPLMAAQSGGRKDCTITVHVSGMNDYAVNEGDITRRFRLSEGECVVRTEAGGNADDVHIAIPASFATSFARNANWLLYLAMERPLLKYGRIVVHASAVIYGGEAYLFSAPSGGGKSTQADIWHDKRGAEILNGDKVILRPTHGGVIAYGSPIAGSSGIYVNKSAPVRAICMIDKAYAAMRNAAAFGHIAKKSKLYTDLDRF